MKQQMTLGELAAELLRQDQEAVDLVAPTKALTLVGDYTKEELVIEGGVRKARGVPMVLKVEDEVFTVSDRTHRQLGTFLGIPSKHYDRLRYEQPDLLEWEVNQMLQRTDAKRLVRTLDGNARAFLSQTYDIGLSNKALADYLLPTVSELGGEVESCAITEAKAHIKVIMPKIERAVRKVGDLIQLGVNLFNSEVGSGKWGFDLFTKNLACTNGMTVENSGFARQHLGAKLGNGDESVRRFLSSETLRTEGLAYVQGARDVMRGLLTEETLAAHVAKLEEALDTPIVEGGTEEKVVQKVERIAKSAGLSEGEGQSVLDFLVRGGDLSLYGLAQAVTRASAEVESYDRASDLERLGGQIITLPRSKWGIGDGDELEAAA